MQIFHWIIFYMKFCCHMIIKYNYHTFPDDFIPWNRHRYTTTHARSRQRKSFQLKEPAWLMLSLASLYQKYLHK